LQNYFRYFGLNAYFDRLQFVNLLYFILYLNF